MCVSSECGARARGRTGGATLLHLTSRLLPVYVSHTGA